MARQARLVAISHTQTAAAPAIEWAGVVPNGIDVNRYPAGSQRGRAVVFLGRISPYKGTHIAIDAARAAGRPLVIAGAGTIPQERTYFDTKIRPCLGQDVTWVGELDFDKKVELLTQAACLVFPARWDEPFGLVLIEAMACGCPVAGLRAGAVPELVVNGETGILCDAPAELGAAIRQAARLDPASCRAHVEKHFSASRMVTGYESIYRQVAGHG